MKFPLVWRKQHDKVIKFLHGQIDAQLMTIKELREKNERDRTFYDKELEAEAARASEVLQRLLKLDVRHGPNPRDPHVHQLHCMIEIGARDFDTIFVPGVEATGIRYIIRLLTRAFERELHTIDFARLHHYPHRDCPTRRP